jgi:hypothetical protein
LVRPAGSSAWSEQQRLRAEQPLVAADSVDVVVSNCVLNLVAPEHKQRLFSEIFRARAASSCLSHLSR